ncbi:MAG: hypothetical protein MUO85_02535 [candidate division Zixibacteria bacterium]|nr:hypothetical protein [candidate division Zixibacteria bacterium]
MKRFVVLVIAVLFVLFAAGTIYAADAVTVTVTMTGYVVNVDSTSWAIGTVTPSLDTVRQQKSYVWNSGGVLMDVLLSATNTTNWKLRATAARDTFQMRALFSHKDTTGAPSEGSFAAEDTLTTGSAIEPNATRYVWANGGLGTTTNGIPLDYGDSIGLWLYFKAPTTSSFNVPETLTVTVGSKVAD